MSKISVVISVYNQEDKIENCLKSVEFADEIIIVNSGSTDKTAEIAKQFTSKIFNRENNFMLNINKNFGFSKASKEWILNIDSDEIVSPELAKEIKDRISNSTEISGFWIPRKNIILGKWIEHTGWYPDYQLRLFKKGKGKFPEEHVHEMIRVDGETEYLDEPIIHYNYDSIDQFIIKTIQIYAPNEAEQLIKKGYVFNSIDALRFPFKEFLSRYFARDGYKDGFHGLILSILMAFYHFIIFTKIWEKQGLKETKDVNLEKKIESEIKNECKELSFWLMDQRIKSSKNAINKTLLKIQKKLAI